MWDTTINWLHTHEFIAIWLEGIALVLIFVWDRLDNRKQHEEILAQLTVSQRHADAAMESLELLRAQSEQRTAQELTHVITILRGVAVDVEFWKPFVTDKWGTAPSTVHLIPDDWPLVVYHAGRISVAVRGEILEVYTELANANSKITEFLSMPTTARGPAILTPARQSLEKVEPLLREVIEIFENGKAAAAGAAMAHSTSDEVNASK